jgi:hypothetical protein
MIPGDAFRAAMENVRRNTAAGSLIGKPADALKYRILIALEGAEPVLTKADRDKLAAIRSLADRRLRHDEIPEDDFGRGYNQAMRDIEAMLVVPEPVTRLGDAP